MIKFENIQKKYNTYLKLIGNRLSLWKYHFLCECLSELFGTIVFLIFGIGVMIQHIIGIETNQPSGLFISISIGWGLAKTMSLLITGVRTNSGLINPALTFAYSLIGKISLKYVIPYTLIHLFGSIIGSLIIIGVYWENIQTYTNRFNYDMFDMNVTGSLFIYIPTKSHLSCFLDHLLSTALFAALVLAIMDKNNYDIPEQLQPIYIGLVVTGIVGSLCLNTGAALNPARDLGPRIAIALCGWSIKPFISHNHYFWIPIIGPYIGAIIGSFCYQLTIGFHLIPPDENKENLFQTTLDRKNICYFKQMQNKSNETIVKKQTNESDELKYFDKKVEVLNKLKLTNIPIHNHLKLSRFTINNNQK